MTEPHSYPHLDPSMSPWVSLGVTGSMRLSVDSLERGLLLFSIEFCDNFCPPRGLPCAVLFLRVSHSALRRNIYFLGREMKRRYLFVTPDPLQKFLYVKENVSKLIIHSLPLSQTHRFLLQPRSFHRRLGHILCHPISSLWSSRMFCMFSPDFNLHYTLGWGCWVTTRISNG